MARSGPRFRVTFTNYRLRSLDDDNRSGGYKNLRDVIAEWLGLSDHQDMIAWEYGEQLTRGQQGTVVKIEQL